ncbi:M23 family metallopeptidase [Priestia aryabhattai]|uniref:M23 family metallopeptidase n=1 Tax=Priestia aryabhattai TaxID=412384 RepID=UPI0039A1987E
MKVKLNGNDFYDVSTRFGVTDRLHPKPHSGIDLVMPTGTEIHSPVEGVISKIVDYGSENAGKCITIKTDSGDSVIMGHLSDFKAEVGQHIDKGDIVALSGNTGHSTGAHLHLGLKNADGHFVNPQPLFEKTSLKERFMENGKVDAYQNEKIQDMSFWEFLKEWKQHGFFEAMYGDSFFNVTKDFLAEFFHDLGMFILGSGDLFFLIPSIALMFATFVIGRNKYTKYIIPLFFAYFVTTLLHKLIQ